MPMNPGYLPRPGGGTRSSGEDPVTILHRKASSGDVDYLKGLEGGDVTYRLLLERDQFGNTALHWASRFGHAQFVDEILNRCRTPGGSDVVPPPPQFRPPTTSCFDLLLMANDVGDTAAHEAIRHNHTSVAMKLLGEDSGVSAIVNNNSESLLYLAAERGLEEVVGHLLHQAGSRNDGPQGTTVLHAAIKSGPRSGVGIAKLLLKERPVLNETANHRGDIPLHHAAYMGDKEMVSALLPLGKISIGNNGSVVYRGNKDGNTPIHMAAMAGNLPVLRALMEGYSDAGAIINNQGRNALHLAIAYQRTNAVEYLLQDPNIKHKFNLVYQRDVDGNGPLHVAALHYDLRILRLLLADPGVDNLGRNHNGQTASDVFYSMVEPEPSLQWYEAKLLLKKAIPHVQLSAGNEQKEKEELNKKLLLRRKTEMEIQSQVDKDRGKVFMVAILIAAIAFAAAFTVPAGSSILYRNGGTISAAQGGRLPIVLDVVAFMLFIVSDMIALSTSLAAIFLCVYAAWDTINSVLPYWTAIRLLMKFSLIGISLAFASGMFVIPATKVLWLAILACTMTGNLPFVIHTWIKPEPLKAAAYHLSEGTTTEKSGRSSNNIAQTSSPKKEPMHAPQKQEATTAQENARTTSTQGLGDQPITEHNAQVLPANINDPDQMHTTDGI